MSTHINPVKLVFFVPIPSAAGGVDPNGTQAGTIYFGGAKTATVLFDVPFAKVPSIVFTPNDNVAFPPYKAAVTKTYFTVKIQTVWTGSVDWLAIKRP